MAFKEFEFKGIKYQVPLDWDSVTLKQQIEVSNAVEEFKNEITKRIALISGYCGIPVDVLKKSTPKEVGKLFKHLEFLGEPIPEKQIVDFKFKNESYNISQNLLDQEFQDFISLESAIANAENDVYKALPLIIAILAKKEGETLDDFDVEERAKEFEQLPISIANGLAVFFYANVKQYTILTQLSLNQEQVIAMKTEEAKNSLSKLDGGGLLTRLLKVLLRIYVWSLNLHAKKLLHSTQLKSSTPKWKKIYRRLLLKGQSTKPKVKNKPHQ